MLSLFLYLQKTTCHGYDCPHTDRSLMVLRLAKERQLELQVSTQSLTDTEFIIARNKNSFAVFSEMVLWMLNHITDDRKFIQRKTPGDILMMTPEEFVGKMRE